MPAPKRPTAKSSERTAIDWIGYIDRARELAFAAEEIWATSAPQKLTKDDYLHISTYNLRIGLLVHYHAALDLLRHPLTAFAAETLVRGELEALSHLAWIAHGEPRSSRPMSRWRGHCYSDNRKRWSNPQTRALCWLIADARQYHANLKQAHRSVKDAKATRKARVRLRTLQRRHRASGCPGSRGRDYSDIAPMLMRLARANKSWWLPSLWRAYSATAHQGIPRRLQAVVDPATLSHGGPISDIERRNLLNRSLIVFTFAYTYVVTLSSGASAGRRYESQGQAPTIDSARELMTISI
jgi:hypothetical protein